METEESLSQLEVSKWLLLKFLEGGDQGGGGRRVKSGPALGDPVIYRHVQGLAWRCPLLATSQQLHRARGSLGEKLSEGSCIFNCHELPTGQHRYSTLHAHICSAQSLKRKAGELLWGIESQVRQDLTELYLPSARVRETIMCWCFTHDPATADHANFNLDQ